MSQNAAFDAHAVRRRAHQRWLDRGCPVGSSEQDWLEAEQELSAEAVRAGTPSRTLTSTAVTEDGGRPLRSVRAPRRIVTRAASAPAARLLVALVPGAAQALTRR
jgi:hypothetical protein